MSLLEDLQKDILCQVYKLLGEDYTHKTHQQITQLSSKILNVIEILTDLKQTCDKAAVRISEDLSACVTDQDLIHHTAGGMIMYPGRSLAPVLKTIMTPAGLPLTVPRIDHIQNIPNALHYYEGPDYPPGFYMRINVAIVQVPWVSIYHTSPYPPCTRCKHYTKVLCDKYRNDASILYKIPQKKCYYAHQGDQLPCIVHNSRCLTLPEFGSAGNRANQQAGLTIADIKSLLLHGLVNIASASLAIESKTQNIVLTNIDKV